MNILVTGGAGYIGSHLVEKLINNTDNIFIIDNLSTGHKSLIHDQAKFIEEDIKNKNRLAYLIKSCHIDTIFHLAACLNVKEAEENKYKYRKNNIEGTKNLIMACENSNVRNFIFSSSCSIYGNVKGSVNEKRKPNPEGYYAYTKYISEKLIRKYSNVFKYKYGILRYFNVAGASESLRIGEIEESHGHLIKNIAIQSILDKPVLNIFGNDYPTKDGTCIRDYIHVSDLVDIHLKGINYLSCENKSFILNCGYGKGYSVKQIADAFREIKENVRINYQERRIGDVAEVYSDTAKLSQLFKWKPKNKAIKEIMMSAIEWEKILKQSDLIKK
tara:strand:- start:512 stop:1501 length:990 start_codon:yes stop_codon:yes gene_type:complete